MTEAGGSTSVVVVPTVVAVVGTVAAGRPVVVVVATVVVVVGTVVVELVTHTQGGAGGWVTSVTTIGPADVWRIDLFHR